MKFSSAPARRRIVHLPHGIARAYPGQQWEDIDLKALWRDLWFAVEMQSLTPDLGVPARRIVDPRSSARGSRRPVQDIRSLSLPARLDREFAALARAHGFTPSMAIAFVMGWRALHPKPTAAQ